MQTRSPWARAALPHWTSLGTGSPSSLDVSWFSWPPGESPSPLPVHWTETLASVTSPGQAQPERPVGPQRTRLGLRDCGRRSLQFPEKAEGGGVTEETVRGPGHHPRCQCPPGVSVAAGRIRAECHHAAPSGLTLGPSPAQGHCRWAPHTDAGTAQAAGSEGRSLHTGPI